MWRDEWRTHANGVVGVLESVIAAEDPARLGGLFRRMFGDDAICPIPGGFRLAVGLSRIDVIDASELAARFGAAVPAAQGRREWMAALVLRTRGVDMAEAALRAGGIALAEHTADRVLVGPEQTMGVTLAFVA